jgi:cold shock CspA family protein
MKRIGRVERVLNGFSFIEDYHSNNYYAADREVLGTKKLSENLLVSFEIKKGNPKPKAVNIEILPDFDKIDHDNEDKKHWCEIGAAEEAEFIEKIEPYIEEKLMINPEKKDDATAIDLSFKNINRYADLKTQRTPFFKANEFYDFDPRYTVTFNRNDYQNYSINYNNPMIYFWVNWKELNKEIKNCIYEVEPLYGVWKVSLLDITQKIENGEAPLHKYINRRNDNENARDSYLLDLREFNKIYPPYNIEY